jgi:poly(A) polymerase
MPAKFGIALDAPWLKSGPVARVLALLNRDGEEARVVGGAVRNALLKVPIGDIDIATTALPAEVIRRAREASLKSVPTGIEHGTVTLVVDTQPFEVTTLREDTETFGRKAKVAFGRDWVRDAERRDFTINGLSVDAEGIVHDHVGGLDDILAKRVRFIGDPGQRIAEDYLRILRFFRIHAAYGTGDPDRAGYLACIAARAGLGNLSAERVRMEMLKLMVADGAADAVVAMADGGLLLRIFGGVAYTGPFFAMISAERALGLGPDPVRRLGALGVAVTEDAKRLAGRLRLSNNETRALDSMGHRWWRLRSMDEATARRRLYRLGVERYRDRLMLAWARAGGNADAAPWLKLATLPARWSAPKFPLKAADFIARGIPEGPALGQVLALAEDAWLAADFPLDQPALEVIADQTVARFTRDPLP